jgi:hypothetical protein
MISPSPNTIVIYTTDNSAETLARRWCHALPGRKEYQLGGRLPCPGDDAGPRVVPPRTEINEIFSAEDWATTWLLPPVNPLSRKSFSRAMTRQARISRFALTATISAICSPARARTTRRRKPRLHLVTLNRPHSGHEVRNRLATAKYFNASPAGIGHASLR